MNLLPTVGFPLSNSFGAPSFKIDAVFEMHRKNADAVVRATYVVWDGLHEMAERQGELIAAAVNGHTSVALDVFTQESFEEKASKQVGALRDVYVSGVASLREQSGIAAQANVTAGDILSTRISEAIDEVGMLFGKPDAPATVSGATDAAVAEPAATVDAAIVAEPAAGVGEAAAAEKAALVEVVATVSPAAKTRPTKPSPPARPARRPTSRD